MSRPICRTVSGGRSRSASYVGRTMRAMSAAERAKVRASKPNSNEGCTNASTTPTSDGSTISTMLCGGPGDRVRLGDAVPPDQDGQGAEHGTVEEDADGGAEERHGQHVRHGDGGEDVGERDGRDERGAEDVGGDHHPLAVPAVGEGAGEQAEEQVGQRLERRDQGGGRRRPAAAVDDDRERDQRDDGAGDREHPGQEVADEVGVAEDRGSRRRHGAARCVDANRPE